MPCWICAPGGVRAQAYNQEMIYSAICQPNLSGVRSSAAVSCSISQNDAKLTKFGF